MIKAGDRYKRKDGTIIMPMIGTMPGGVQCKATLFEWQTGSVSGFGTWEDLQAEIDRGEVELIEDRP